MSEKDFITLREASKNCEYSQEYLSLRARQGKLRAIKRGKKWVTTKDWLNKYIAQTEEYKEKLEEKRKEKPDTLEKKISDFLQSPSSEKTPAVPVSDEDSAEMFFDLPSTDFSDIEREIEAISFSNKLNRKPRKNRNNFALALSLALVLLLIGAVSARENILRFASKTNSYVESTGEVGEEIMTGSLKTAVQSLKTVSADVSFVVKRTKSDPNYTASVFRSFYGWANEEVRRAVSYIYEKGKEGAKDIEIGSEKIARDISKFFNKPFVLEKSEEPSKDFRPTTTEEKTYQQEIQFLQEEVRRLKEKGLVTKETVREVERVTQIQPVKEITKLTIDSASLSSMQEDIGQLKESVESTKDNVTVIEKTTYKTIDKAVSTPAAPHAPTRIGSTYITKDSISVTGTGSFTSNLTSGGNIKGEKIEIEDSNTYIEVDSSGNIAFTDSVTGTKTLAQLSSGSGSVLDLDGDFLTIDTDGDTQMKAYADDIISLDIGGAGTGEYLFSGTELNLSDNNFTTTGTLVSGAATIDSTLVLSSGSITDSGGTIDFGDENLTTTGTITSATSTATVFTDGTASLTGGSLTSVKLGSLTSNGFVKTGSGDGTLSVDTSTYLKTDGSNADSNIDIGSYNFTTTGTFVSGAATIDSTLVLSSGSITDSGGTIDFGDENLTTTGDLEIGPTSGSASSAALEINSGALDDVERPFITFTGIYNTGGALTLRTKGYDGDSSVYWDIENGIYNGVIGSSEINRASLSSNETFTFKNSSPDFGIDVTIGEDGDGSSLTVEGDIKIDEDDKKLLLGEGNDASIYYDGTDLIIDPKEVGSGSVDLNGGSLTTTGTLVSGAATIDSTLVLSSGSITDSGGTIDFGDENLTTTGDITGGNLNVSDWDTGFYETGGVVKQYNPDYDEDFVFGSSQLADAGATYDSRFFFDKSKAAFRAGKVTETEWDDANVGDYSVAFGHNTKSTGDGSISLGYNLGSASVIESTGPGSFSGGYTSGTALNIIRASNNGSFAFGEVSGGLSAYGTIIASGQGSVAMGRGLGRADILSSGTGSIALGYANAANLTATGNASVAIGEDVNATANNALSFGKSFTNNTASSFAVGFGRQNLTVTDGNITMAATEDLVFDMTGSTANTVSLSSSTGVDTIDFGSFALTTTGKITASGGVDPPYVLYDPQTRDRLVARVLEEVPLDKQRGASLYYNEETDQLEVYFADRDKFFEVAMTEIQLEEDGSVAGANIDTENDSYFIQKVKKAVSYLGLKIENGIASVRELVTEKLVAKTARMNKMEMVDQATGQAYCTWIENGVWKKVKGSCEEKSNMGGAVNAGSGSNSGNSQDNSDRGDDKEDGVNAGDSQDAADAGDTGDNEGSEDDSDINSATDDSDNGNTENSTDSVDAGEVADTDDTGSSDDKEDGVNAGDSQDAADAGDTGGNEGSENDSDINSTTDDSDNDDTEGGSSGSAGNSENTTNSDNSAEGDSDTGGSGDAGSTGGNGLDNASAGDSGDGGGNSNGSEGGDSGTGGTGDTGNAEAAGGSSGGDAPSN